MKILLLPALILPPAIMAQPSAKDNRSHQVSSSFAHDAEDIARYLVEALYL